MRTARVVPVGYMNTLWYEEGRRWAAHVKTGREVRTMVEQGQLAELRRDSEA
jgi:hypothetical protein